MRAQLRRGADRIGAVPEIRAVELFAPVNSIAGTGPKLVFTTASSPSVVACFDRGLRRLDALLDALAHAVLATGLPDQDRP